MYDKNLQEDDLCIVEFADVEDAIDLAMFQWQNLVDPIGYANTIRRTNAELEESDKEEEWLCLLGNCDICGSDSAIFIPACAYEDGIAGIECRECDNMAVYPKKLEKESESENDD